MMLACRVDAERRYTSHPPMRPLPVAANRPLADGPTFYVDQARGDDQADGSRDRPWRTVAHALGKAKAGETVCLRAGVYYATPEITTKGEPNQPITLRSFPGELVVLDGGFAEFAEQPADAWEPAPGGSTGEFRSTKTYPGLSENDAPRRGVHVLGNFIDSMVPLHGYRNLIDLRSDNPCWTVGDKLNTEIGVYCGPGLWYDPATQRIHVRLAPTTLKVLGESNYRGETDPRKLALVVAGDRPALRLSGTNHLRILDLVLRGSAGRTLDISQCNDIEMEGLTVYGGCPAVFVEASSKLRFTHCVVRGLSGPWSSRASHKYRGNSPYLLILSPRGAQVTDVELAHCEFTDNHDGLILGTASNVRFHHNLVDNFDDDGLYLTLERSAPPRDIHIYQNYISRTLTALSFAWSDDQVRPALGPGVYIYRNVMDFRRGTYGMPPRSAELDASTTFEDHCRAGRPCGDHGSPYWEPMFFYHNTVIAKEKAFRNFYGLGMGGHTQNTTRRLFNNIFVQIDGLPGLAFNSADDNLQADGNLHWNPTDGPRTKADEFFAPMRKNKMVIASVKQYPPGWGAADRMGDPKFVRFSPNWPEALDLRPGPDSAAVDSGLEIPKEWPDPLRDKDAGKPDIGAYPAGVEAWPVGPMRERR